MCVICSIVSCFFSTVSAHCWQPLYLRRSVFLKLIKIDNCGPPATPFKITEWFPIQTCCPLNDPLPCMASEVIVCCSPISDVLGWVLTVYAPRVDIIATPIVVPSSCRCQNHYQQAIINNVIYTHLNTCCRLCS